MTEPGRGPETAGSLLRAARDKQGLHIAALAAAIKVAPRKLDALENNRWDELPDATFTRALAQTVCRTLKIDARPVLELLPAAGAGTLENVAGTLNTPFSERGSHPSGAAGAAVRPMVWAGGLLLLAALVVYFVPSGYWAALLDGEAVVAVPTPAFPASEAVSATVAAEPVQALTLPPPPVAASASPDAAAPAPAASVALAPPAAATAVAAVEAPAQPTAASGPPAPNSILILVVQASWIEARDAQGRVLVSRLVGDGEKLQLDGELPVRLVIGNAAGVELSFRQQRIDLPALTRDNVARLQLP